MWECTDDIQANRKIQISKNGTLNIYIAVDVSESIDKEHVDNAKEAILKLITKVRSGFNCLYQNMMLGKKPIPDKNTVVRKFYSFSLTVTHSCTNGQNWLSQRPVTRGSVERRREALVELQQTQLENPDFGK